MNNKKKKSKKPKFKIVNEEHIRTITAFFIILFNRIFSKINGKAKNQKSSFGIEAIIDEWKISIVKYFSEYNP